MPRMIHVFLFWMKKAFSSALLGTRKRFAATAPPSGSGSRTSCAINSAPSFALCGARFLMISGNAENAPAPCCPRSARRERRVAGENSSSSPWMSSLKFSLLNGGFAGSSGRMGASSMRGYAGRLCSGCVFCSGRDWEACPFCGVRRGADALCSGAGTRLCRGCAVLCRLAARAETAGVSAARRCAARSDAARRSTRRVSCCGAADRCGARAGSSGSGVFFFWSRSAYSANSSL